MGVPTAWVQSQINLDSLVGCEMQGLLFSQMVPSGHCESVERAAEAIMDVWGCFLLKGVDVVVDMNYFN